jgi:hypothetical protein
MRRFFRAFILTLLLSSSVITGAAVGVLGFRASHGTPPKVERITFSPGGDVDEFIEHYSDLRVKGARVIVDGSCISACTLAAGLLPPERICATPMARLVFHSAFYEGAFGEKKFAKDATEIIWHIYPVKLRELLRSKGWNAEEHNDLIFIEGDELNSVIRPCTPEDMATSG